MYWARCPRAEGASQTKLCSAKEYRRGPEFYCKVAIALKAIG